MGTKMTPLQIIAFTLTVTAVLATPTPKAEASDYRLPEIYEVSNYALNLIVPSEAFTDKGDTYTGNVAITFSFTNLTDYLYLHAHHETITLKKVTFNNIKLDEDDYSVDNVTDILKISMVNPIKVNTKYILIIEYEGKLSTTTMYGFYKSSYVEGKNTKYLATTQFEPTHARRAFPCFDEPAYKATFDVSINHPSGLSVLFNTNKANETLSNDTSVVTTIFERTPKMSTYLLAFIVSEFTCTTGNNITTATYQVCSRNDTADKRKFAVETGPLLLSALDTLTNYDYDLNMEKMDQVAIPDFSAGAMENWGLITYRETALLWDENESSNKYKQSVATVIAHEFTHQWFGNLVTCGWWSETFLNEGFARYFQYFIAHEVFPDWELDKQFVIETIQYVLRVDELENTQAVQSDCSTPTEISAKFGDISYSKGASVLSMVSNFMGKTNFVAGLRTYLVNNEYTAAKPEKLWAALSTTVDDTVSKLPADLSTVMDSWITKPGFPLLTVKLNDSKLTISQERFLVSGTVNSTKWYVPITYTSSLDANKFVSTSPAAWLTPDADLTITYPANSSWIILNNQVAGYYRVNYDDTLWGYIKNGLYQENFDGITEINRAQIVDDLFSLAKINKISYIDVFDITKFLTNDTSYYPWYAASQGYSFLLKRVGENSKLGEAISASLLSTMKNLYQSVPSSTLNDANQIYTLKQVLALTWACKLGEETCVDDAKKLFSAYKESGTRPDKNLRSIVYCNGLRYSENSSDWEFLWNAYLAADDLASERGTILSALGCTKDVTLLEEYLNKTITDGSGIRSQDAASVFSAVYTGNQEGVAVAYNFLTNNYKTISDKYQSMNSLSSIIKGIADWFTTEEEVNKLQDFISTGDLPDEFKNSATQALETAQSNLKWLQQFEDDLMEIFDVSSATKVTVSSVVTLLIAVVVMVVLS